MDKIRKFVKSHGKGLILVCAIVMVAVGVRQVHPTNENTMEETVSETTVSKLEVVQELATEGYRGTEAQQGVMPDVVPEPAWPVLDVEVGKSQASILDSVPEEKSEMMSDTEKLGETEEDILVLPEPENVAVKDSSSMDAKESEDATEATLESSSVTEVEPEPVPMPEETTTEMVVPEPADPETTSAPCMHSWIFDSYFQVPDCSNGGLENQICVLCGETRTVGGTPTGKHDYIVETEGDCCSEEIIRCTVCNNREVREKNPDNHIDLEDGICYGCGTQVE